jgi:hypothetical protein
VQLVFAFCVNVCEQVVPFHVYPLAQFGLAGCDTLFEQSQPPRVYPVSQYGVPVIVSTLEQVALLTIV